MSTEFKFQASVKDSDGDMVNVRADSEAELEHYLTSFPVAAYAQFKANVRGGSALGQISQPQQQAAAQPQQNQGWGGQQNQQQAQPQQAAPQQQQRSQYAGTPHPEGKACEACGKTLEQKKTSGGKFAWRCPDWRWNNGTPNEHTSEWAS